MAAIRFNAITYANKLKNAKDNNERADIQAEELSNIINNELATKQDIDSLKHGTKQEMALLKQDIISIKNEMIIKLGSIMVAGIVVLGMIIKL